MITFRLVIEFMLLATCPLPFIDFYVPLVGKNGIVVNYFLSEFMLSVMAFRGFYIIRTMFNYSIYTDPYSKKLCQ